jgi:phosphoribosyl 1,2-cyclic phosphodiesterase
MPLALGILASGSAGNCGVLRTRHGAVLIDCGIGPRTAATRLKSLGLALSDIRAICLTHLDSDHLKPTWITEIIRRKIFLYCHQSRVDDLTQQLNNRSLAPYIRPFEDRLFNPLPGVGWRAIALPHDERGSHGFVIECQDARIGYATDLGRVDARLIDKFSGLDLLAIESNYDPQMQRDSARPYFLKRRIMGGRGHLSNEQAFEAVRQILDRSQTQGRELPRHIVLLHRSRQCNCPRLLRELFAGDSRIASRLVLAEQDRPTVWLAARSNPPPHTQMRFDWQWSADESSRPSPNLPRQVGQAADHAPPRLPAEAAHR